MSRPEPSPAGPAAEPRGRSRAARLLPWLVAAALLAWLLRRVPFAALRGGMAAGPWGPLVVYTLLLAAATLAADAVATRVALAAVGLQRPFSILLLVRGATYLLGLVNYALGQGGVGFYLHRTGVRAARASGTVLFLLIVNVAALAAVAAAGLAFPGGPPPQVRLGPFVAAAGLGTLAYLAAIAVRPALLARREVLSPLFEAGIGGHLTALAGRLPHVLLLALGQWGALWIWGVHVPAGRALVLMPIALVAAALPIAPAGLGTLQAAQVLLFAPYAAAPDRAGREAQVLAFSLAFALLGLVFQAATGLLCLAALRRRGIEPTDTTDAAGA